MNTVKKRGAEPVFPLGWVCVCVCEDHAVFYGRFGP